MTSRRCPLQQVAVCVNVIRQPRQNQLPDAGRATCKDGVQRAWREDAALAGRCLLRDRLSPTALSDWDHMETANPQVASGILAATKPERKKANGECGAQPVAARQPASHPKKQQERIARCGIRTHAWRTRLRPERSALTARPTLHTTANARFCIYKYSISPPSCTTGTGIGTYGYTSYIIYYLPRRYLLPMYPHTAVGSY